jgi:hypothetical protein
MIERRITIDDIMAAGHCAKGARSWFRTMGLDFTTFLKDGLPASDLLATGDALAEQVVSRAMSRGDG